MLLNWLYNFQNEVDEMMETLDIDKDGNLVMEDFIRKDEILEK